jgi:hypothetical protein
MNDVAAESYLVTALDTISIVKPGSISLVAAVDRAEHRYLDPLRLSSDGIFSYIVPRIKRKVVCKM